MIGKLFKNKLIEMRNGMQKSDAKEIALQKNETLVIKDEYSYLEDNNELHRANLYHLKDDEFLNKSPLIIDIHGGGWVYGDKDLNGLFAMDLVKKGFLVYSMSYSLAPEKILNDEVKDVFASIHFLLTLINKYNIDPERIYLTGDSAGAHLAALFMAINNSPKLQSIYDVKKVDIKIQKVILNHPGTFIKNIESDLISKFQTKMLKKIMFENLFGRKYKKNPIFNHISLDEFVDELDNSIPYLIITSKLDTVVGIQAYKSYDLLKEKGFNVYLYNEEDGECVHVFNVTRPYLDISLKCNQYIIDFINE